MGLCVLQRPNDENFSIFKKIQYIVSAVVLPSLSITYHFVLYYCYY